MCDVVQIGGHEGESFLQQTFLTNYIRLHEHSLQTLPFQSQGYESALSLEDRPFFFSNEKCLSQLYITHFNPAGKISLVPWSILVNLESVELDRIKSAQTCVATAAEVQGWCSPDSMTLHG